MEYFITGCYNRGIVAWVPTIMQLFLFIVVDSSLMQWFYIRDDVTLGLWMLPFESLLIF